MAIRNAHEDDLPAVGQLAGQLVRMHHTWDAQRWMMPSGVEEGYARFFAGQLDDPDTVILVAEDSLGEVVGYAYAALEPRSWADLREACGKLHDLFVVTRARRQGIGKALTREAMARLRDLGAPPGSARALPFARLSRNHDRNGEGARPRRRRLTPWEDRLGACRRFLAW
jgi:GNAT superfamily N-acetyltransferase